MIFGLWNRAFSRAVYEAGRIRRVLPTLVRLGISELEDAYHRFSYWRGTCDHEVDRGPGRRAARKVKRVGKQRR